MKKPKRVRWEEYPPLWGGSITYEGEVIQTISKIFFGTYFLVDCTDGKIREVSIENVEVIK